MNKIVICLLFFVSAELSAQNKPTDKITVSGLLEKEFQIDVASLKASEEKNVGSVLITNHLGQPEFTLRNVKGVKVKDLLKDIVKGDPKNRSEFYLVFVSDDDYKVVFSWNELFNTVLGDEVYIITERDNIPLENMKERLALISPMDESTRHRYMNNLGKIIVKRVE